MALDYLQVRQQVQQLGEKTSQNRVDLAGKLDETCRLLEQHSQDIDALQYKVEVARVKDPTLRCAVPFKEPLRGHYALPSQVSPATVIAADGSQIFADRHAAVDYGLINTGAICMQSGAPQAPVTSIRSRLIYAEGLDSMTDDRLSLQRDLAERERLLELAREVQGPVITLTDGPLEIWINTLEQGRVAGEFRKSLERYLDLLGSLHELGVAAAGYVDKPGADLVVRLLEVTRAEDTDLAQLRTYRPLKGVTDSELFRGVLMPGERSAVFAIQSHSSQPYQGDLALHFYYLNVGRAGHPYLARVEIPSWVAHNQAMLDNLHAELIRQCGMIGARRYPYILHRAHETAVVTMQDKQQVTEMIVGELRRKGLEVAGESAKQYNKDISGTRKRYGQ